MDFTDKAVLITGSSRGIGSAAARAFLERGARVAVNGRSEASVATAMALLGPTERLVAAPGDVSSAAGCAAAVETAVAGLGGLDVLVNSAGICEYATVAESDEDFWDRTLDINLKGSFFCVRAALPALRERRGSIVNLASDAGLMGNAELTVYCASKGGVINLTRALAYELAPEVRVNCVCPGYVDTDMVRRDYFAQTADPAETERQALDYAPMKRMARPEEVAKAIVYLASEDAGFITGAALPIDGGGTAGH